MKTLNPLAFRPGPVNLILSSVYIALLAALLVVHYVLPSVPKSDTPYAGVSISEAFSDLQVLSDGFHPYNSRRNDVVRSWLLSRIGAILESNGANYTTIQTPDKGPSTTKHSDNPSVVVFNDLQANVTFATETWGVSTLSTYFEGTNIIVYVRGKQDIEGSWWAESRQYSGSKGVLVNAHYDSVSTGYGATDDGVGVVSVLQLLSHFTSDGHQPEHGIVLLLNNGEEDYLNGARAFVQHPTSKFTDRFLNLEGAGAGGRAALFRTTDTEVTRFFKGAKHPFASSVSDDGFKRKLISSETDYRVFVDDLGLRGLDVAFLEPRSRYHTNEDDAKHTSREALWHMLSAALPTVAGLANNELGDGATEAVWFDLFGRSFAVMELHTLFALQVTLLVIAPISLFALGAILAARGKLYLFQRRENLGDERVPLGCWKGCFRAPLIFAISSAVTIAMAFLITKFNPFIAMSSPWAVWTCFASIWIFVTWFQSRFTDYVRPTALHRLYTLGWLHLGVWVLGVGAAAFEDRGVASGYLIFFNGLGIWLATFIALIELFALPSKSEFAAEQLGLPQERNVPTLSAPDDDPTERTALLGDEQSTTFRPRSRRTDDLSTTVTDDKPANVYGYEQWWSGSLPSWLWSLQFLFLSVPALVFLGPIVPLITAALTQTLSDGNSPLGLYLPMAILTILVVAPVQPFIHRSTYHVNLFLLFAFAGSLVYNLTAFPFSANNKLKLYFVQEVDLDTGVNNVMLRGADPESLVDIAQSLPSTRGQSLNVTESYRKGTFFVKYHSLAPTVVPPHHPELPPEIVYEDWLHLNTSRTKGKQAATFTLSGQKTRNCRLYFDTPVTSLHIEGSGDGQHNYPYKPVIQGTTELRLWRRDWTENPWVVHVAWDGDRPGLDGRAVCMWNQDEEQPDGGIPALQEYHRHAPVWATVSKNGDGLIEGTKRFMV